MLLKSVLFSLALYTALALFHSHRFLSKPPSVPSYEYETLYFDTLVDHFSFVNNDKFPLKYLISTKFHLPNGPVLFYTGNEGSIETFAENSGFLWEHAEELSAAVIFAEHRYYGTSLPFANDSFKDVQHFGYMMAEQALADFVSLVEHLRNSDDRFAKSSFIAFGGSYGGMLAAWLRMKYPNVVVGAIASSAPVWMFPNISDCYGFSRVTTNAFKQSGSVACTQTIGALWNSIQDVAKGPSGYQLLSMIFVLCSPLSSTQPLVDYLSDFFTSIAMANYPYSASFLGDYPDHPVEFFCRDLSMFSIDDSPLDVVRRVSAAVRKLTNYTGTQKCIDINAHSPGLNVNGWDIQTCLEMAVPICADGKNDMFPPFEWDAGAFSSQCQKTYGVIPRLNWAALQFWGKHLETSSHIVFSNGDLDPWSAYGVLDEKFVPHNHVIRIPSGAHHLDLRAKNANDSADVRDARNRIIALIKSWI